MASTSAMTAVNPSHLYFAAAAPSPVSAPSPASSKGSSAAQPSRKRPRTDFQSSEERKEARAERNRIAAQVSRDRRKAEFTDLRDRVTFLERENAALRQQAATSTSLSSPSTSSSLGLAQVPAIGTTSHTVEIERENRELKERVRVLENALSTLSQNVANALKGVGTGSSIGGALSHLLPPSPSSSILPSTSNMTAQTTPTAPAFAAGFTATTTPVNTTTPLVGASASSSTRHLARVATISPAHANTEDWLKSILEGNSSTNTITSTPSPSTPLSTSSPFLLSASSPSASSSSADTDLSALLHTPMVETASSPLLTTVGVSTSSPSLPMLNGTFEVASLFGDDNDTDMEKLLAMLPPAGNASSSPSDATVPEDMWMSNWLKEEPITQGNGVF